MHAPSNMNVVISSLYRFYLIVDHYKFDREVVGIALNYFDRYMFQQPSQYLKRREKVQLVGVASIFVAIKAHSISEEHRTETRARALGHLLRAYFEPKEVTDMEASLFQTLDWQLNPPTMHQFAIIYYMLHPLGKFCKESTLYLYDAARYQAELVAFHPSLFEKFTPSVLAYAAVLNAQENVGEILWPVLKENWLSLMSQPADLVSLDPTQVKEAQTALEEVCPHLPGMDVFEAARQVSSSDGCQDTQRVPSPTNITHY